MRRITKVCSAAVAALALCVTAAACGSDSGGGGGGGEGSGATTITFWDNNGGVRTPIYQELIKRFEAANPTIKVEYVGIPIASVQQKYDTAIAGGETPDVGGVTTSYLANLTGQQALEPADAWLAGSAVNGKVLDSMLASVKQATPDGKLYMVPATSNLDVVWYQKDKLAEAGVEAPETWDEFFTAVGKLTKTPDQYGWTIRGGAGSIFQLLAEAYAYSGVTEFFDASGKSTVNDPANAELVGKIAALYKKATPEADVTNDFPKMVAQFTSGKVAMMHHNLGSYNDHVKAFGAEKIDAYPLPVGASGKRTIVANPVDGFGVFKNSEHKEAAWKFVEFLVSKENNSYWNQQTGQIPANKDAQQDAWIDERPYLKSAVEVLADPATVVVSPPYHLPQFSSITKADTEPLFQKVLLGQMKPQEFLDTMGQMLTEAQAEWKKSHSN
ncbi:sugar ABC transporter substrate-binding protein [Sphaerisporangium sp. TRM90804]|uniref:ABC transporter substrate-binding protein n=1 Tax=Sphaerisporangium sp. TRM90804 TaxID=3031113 RepID=UPI00244BC50B|nr:sugar ABC transporter substrate-binding protein [Sphaerisporangium sp. TRM90804]MDH2425181.1 sugar ABC transporter substrate-binding protein [Sphaerisporangium sp. TRM90804]